MEANTQKTPNRKGVPLFITLLPEERERIDAHAKAWGRPLQWIVRDALRAYMDTVDVKQDPRPDKLLLTLSHEPPAIRRSPGRPPKQRGRGRPAK
jgi:hypothetical protein